ncbi:MAG: HU family DNA-binding protein [Tannerella sp.]|jgi:DNA-binding protein HU-beta|nr:HU family DNA-binding protein [Tannerella sp.]
MNKTDLINVVSAKVEISKTLGKKTVNALIEAICEEIEKGGKVSLLGFGSFSVVQKAARKGINPATKAYVQIPAHKVVKFKAGTDLLKCADR